MANGAKRTTESRFTDKAELRRRARQHVEDGAVTDGHRGDRERLLEAAPVGVRKGNGGGQVAAVGAGRIEEAHGPCLYRGLLRACIVRIPNNDHRDRAVTSDRLPDELGARPPSLEGPDQAHVVASSEQQVERAGKSCSRSIVAPSSCAESVS